MAFLDRVDDLIGVGARTSDVHEIRRHRIVAGIAAFAVVASTVSLVNATLQGGSPYALALGGSVFAGAFVALTSVRRGRVSFGACFLVSAIIISQICSGLFRDGFFVMISPGTIATLVMAMYLVGPKGSVWFACLIGVGILLVFAAHATGNVIAVDVVAAGDTRPMMTFNALLGLPAVWYFQRLDRLAKEAADLRLLQNMQELHEARARLAQKDKLAAVGQLAAGVAHEINNPLAVILGFAQGLERRLEDRPELKKPLASIVRESLRCRDLVSELLTFSRASPREIERFDINEAVRAVVALVEPRAKIQGVGFATQLASEALSIRGNRIQIEQVVMNLANNALDAMEQGGALTVRTLKTEQGTSIAVEDTGTGIAPELRERVFEPFFTTKPVGKGTGLGLSITWEIVHQLGGTIDLASEVGRGTTMTVRLPTSPAAA